MAVEGSITPPLSDDENWIDNQRFIHHASPILKANREICQNSINYEKFVSIKAPQSSSITKFFYIAQSELVFIENNLNSPSSSSCVDNYKAVDNFLTEIKSSIAKFVDTTQSDELLKIIQFLFALSTHVSSLVDIDINYKNLVEPGSLKSLKCNVLHHCKNKYLFKWFHYFCDIYEVLLDVAMKAMVLCNNLQDFKVFYSDGIPISSAGGFVNQVIDRILHDLGFFSFNLFRSNYHLKKDIWKVFMLDPHLCSCFDDLLLKCHNMPNQEKHFWNIVVSILSNSIQYANNPSILSYPISMSSSIFFFKEIQATLSYLWWWIKKLPHTSDIICCHNLINRLLRLSFNNCKNLNQELACHLLCYKKILASLYKPLNQHELKSMELAGFNLVWQNICQNLVVTDGSCSDLKECTLTELSVQKLFSKQSKLLQLPENDLEVLDSFIIFIKILHFLISRNDGKVWILLKDRFFLRFHLSLMKQLNEMGLERFFIVFMTILKYCPVNDADDVINQFVLLLDQFLGQNFSKVMQKQVICGYFAIMHICTKRSLSFESVAKKSGNFFEMLTKMVINQSFTVELRHQYLNTFTLYLDSVIELLRIYEDLLTTQIFFLLPLKSLQLLLRELHDNEFHIVFEFLFELTRCTRLILMTANKEKQQMLQFFTSIVEAFLPSMKKLTTLQTNNYLYDVIGDVTMTLAVMQSKTNCGVHLFESVWSYFTNDCNCDVNFQVNFLNKCLGCNEILIFLNGNYHSSINNNRKSLTNSSTTVIDQVISGWIKCLMLLSAAKLDDLHLLTVKIGNLDIMKDLKNEGQDFVFHVFLQTISQKHKSATNFFEKVKWTKIANVWFGPSLDCAFQAIKDESYIPSIYFTLGSIMQYCSLLLHTGKPSFVTRVMDGFVLDPPNLKCSPLLLESIWNHLDKFIVGCLAIGRNNFHIEQIMHEVTSCYLLKWLHQSTNLNHPFIRALQSTNEIGVAFMLACFSKILDSTHDPNKCIMVVEILHSWISNSTTILDQKLFPDFPEILLKIRPYLRFSDKLVEKLKFITDFFK